MKKLNCKKNHLREKDGRLVCPVCRELLCRQDVESFVRCPYCDHRFHLNEEMEDFLLKPVVENWCQMNLSQQTQQFPQEQDYGKSNWI